MLIIYHVTLTLAFASLRRLRSSLTDQLDVRQSQCSTVGDRAFGVAGARLWNSLPHDIVASDTLSQFRCGLKTFLFRQSYPYFVLVLYLVPCGPCEVKNAQEISVDNAITA